MLLTIQILSLVPRPLSVFQQIYTHLVLLIQREFLRVCYGRMEQMWSGREVGGGGPAAGLPAPARRLLIGRPFGAAVEKSCRPRKISHLLTQLFLAVTVVVVAVVMLPGLQPWRSVPLPVERALELGSEPAPVKFKSVCVCVCVWTKVINYLSPRAAPVKFKSN